MTWSIVARDDAGHFGVAVASRFFAARALCVYTRRGAGALSTQALMNPLYGAAGLDLLGSGHYAAQVVSTLANADAGREQRQLHVLTATGPGAAFTGTACVDWCGHQVHDGFSVAGNMLVGPRVIEATGEAFVACLAGRHDPVGLTDRAQIEASIARFQAARQERGQ